MVAVVVEVEVEVVVVVVEVVMVELVRESSNIVWLVVCRKHMIAQFGWGFNALYNTIYLKRLRYSSMNKAEQTIRC